MRFLAIFFLFIPGICTAQLALTGRVLNAVDNKPVEQASILLNNTTIGTASNTSGQFTLRGIKQGKYELVVSAVGYETYQGSVMVGSDDIDLKDIKLISKSIVLNEVKVKPDAEWFAMLDIFKSEFLGTSDLAADCKILNPEILDIGYTDGKLVLKAHTDDFLVIENWQLGYRIKYLLHDFAKDKLKRQVFYSGSTLFEEMKGSASQEKKWIKNRLKAYYGSPVHFLRSALGNRLEDDNFEVLRLIRDTNQNVRTFAKTQYLVKQPLTVTEFIKRTDQRTLFALYCDNSLYVMYKKRLNNEVNKISVGLLSAPKYEGSVITFASKYALFDINGVITDPHSVVFEGAWAKQRVAELLPVNYEPAP